MKKIVLVLILVCVIMGVAFAQAKPATPAPATPAKPATPAPAKPAAEPAAKEKKNAIALDLFQLMKGIIIYDTNYTFINIYASYERLIVPHFSIGANLDLGIINAFYLAIAAEGRYYPMSNFDKLFLGTTIGFHIYGGASYWGYGGSNGLNMSLKMGYKVTMGGLMYLEPSISYVLSNDVSSSFFSLGGDGGLTGGLRLGFTF